MKQIKIILEFTEDHLDYDGPTIISDETILDLHDIEDNEIKSRLMSSLDNFIDEFLEKI